MAVLGMGGRVQERADPTCSTSDKWSVGQFYPTETPTISGEHSDPDRQNTEKQTQTKRERERERQCDT